jgi:hypothetical protein
MKIKFEFNISRFFRNWGWHIFIGLVLMIYLLSDLKGVLFGVMFLMYVDLRNKIPFRRLSHGDKVVLEYMSRDLSFPSQFDSRQRLIIYTMETDVFIDIRPMNMMAQVSPIQIGLEYTFDNSQNGSLIRK